MNAITISEYKNIKIQHFSTASLIKIIINKDEEVNQGVFENINVEEWYDYSEIENLYKALKQLKNNYNWLINEY